MQMIRRFHCIGLTGPCNKCFMRNQRTKSMNIIVAWLIVRMESGGIDPRDLGPYLMRDIGLVPPAPRKLYFQYL